MAEWSNAFQDISREHGFETLRVEGSLPPGLEGTLYRNGPALFSNFGRRYGHLFDGDGAVSAVGLSANGARGAVKLVQTPGLLAERAAGRPLYGAYGTPNPRNFIKRIGARPKNAANTSVMMWQERLLALFEGGRPVELSPKDLATLGERDFDVIGETFSAHPHRSPSRRAFYNFGTRFGGRTQVDIFELPDAGPVRLLASLPIPPSFVHDFAVTDDYLVFLVPPLRMRLLRQLFGFGRFCDNFDWRPAEGVEVLVVPIDDPGHPIRFAADPFFQFHIGNAYQENGRLELDVVRYPDFAGSHLWLAGLLNGDPGSAHAGRLCRATIDIARRSMKVEERSDLPCEFPQVSPRAFARPHRYAYAAAHSSAQASRTGPFDRLAKIDLTSGKAVVIPLGGDGLYSSEPVFAPCGAAGAEDDGWILALVHDAAKNAAHLAVVDARAPEAGPVARAHFDGPLPPTFHGVWAPSRRS